LRATPLLLLPGQRNLNRSEFQEFLEYLSTVLGLNSLVVRWAGVTSETNRVVIEAEARSLL
jgi:hypothetical protein